MTEAIEPALTPAEWMDAGTMEPGALPSEIEWAVWNRSRGYHYAAALCLHGQPFGFTREDVAKLRAMPDGTGYASIDDPAWFDSLIARIAALLPPE